MNDDVAAMSCKKKHSVHITYKLSLEQSKNKIIQFLEEPY